MRASVLLAALQSGFAVTQMFCPTAYSNGRPLSVRACRNAAVLHRHAQLDQYQIGAFTSYHRAACHGAWRTTQICLNWLASSTSGEPCLMACLHSFYLRALCMSMQAGRAGRP